MDCKRRVLCSPSNNDHLAHNRHLLHGSWHSVIYPLAQRLHTIFVSFPLRNLDIGVSTNGDGVMLSIVGSGASSRSTGVGGVGRDGNLSLTDYLALCQTDRDGDWADRLGEDGASRGHLGGSSQARSNGGHGGIFLRKD